MSDYYQLTDSEYKVKQIQEMYGEHMKVKWAKIWLPKSSAIKENGAVSRWEILSKCIVATRECVAYIGLGALLNLTLRASTIPR